MYLYICLISVNYTISIVLQKVDISNENTETIFIGAQLREKNLTPFSNWKNVNRNTSHKLVLH